MLGTSHLRRSLRCCGTLESRASIKTRSFLMPPSTHLAMHPAMSAMRIEAPMETDEPMLAPLYVDDLYLWKPCSRLLNEDPDRVHQDADRDSNIQPEQTPLELRSCSWSWTLNLRVLYSFRRSAGSRVCTVLCMCSVSLKGQLCKLNPGACEFSTCKKVGPANGKCGLLDRCPFKVIFSTERKKGGEQSDSDQF